MLLKVKLALCLAVWLLGTSHCWPITNSGVISSEDIDREDADRLCEICIDGVKLFQGAVDSNLTLDSIYPLIHSLCLEVQNKANGPYTCPGFIYSYGPVILYVLSKALIEPKVICQDFKFCKKSSYLLAAEEIEYKTRLTPHTREIIDKLKKELNSGRFSAGWDTEHSFPEKYLGVGDKRNTLVANRTMKNQVKPKGGTIRFLQLADIHVDHQYDEGSPSDCGLYMCCRRWYNGTGKAGHYGDYNCDLPMPTLDLLVDTLQSMDPQPDFIVYTGDNAPHDVWNETWTSQLYATEFIVNYLSEKFPDITIYPAIGNHESWPESEYIGTLYEYKALNNFLAERWQKWVDLPQSALDSISEGGYYSAKVMDKLRLISFNSDYGYSLNFYSYLNGINEHYKTQQLWLEQQLQMAKEEGDKVILVAHIPPGDTDNNAEYGQFYLNLTRQYSDTIVGHLFGHTHTDQFQLVQDSEGVYGVALIAPSVTTFGHVNPSFRVFTMDADTKTLLGYEQYIFNLTLANKLHDEDSNVKPKFQRSYTTLDDYGLKDLSPNQWATMVSRFEVEPSLLDKYHFNVHSKSLLSDKACNAKCKKDTLCSVTSAISLQYLECIGEG